MFLGAIDRCHPGDVEERVLGCSFIFNGFCAFAKRTATCVMSRFDTRNCNCDSMCVIKRMFCEPSIDAVHRGGAVKVKVLSSCRGKCTPPFLHWQKITPRNSPWVGSRPPLNRFWMTQLYLHPAKMVHLAVRLSTRYCPNEACFSRERCGDWLAGLTATSSSPGFIIRQLLAVSSRQVSQNSHQRRIALFIQRD